MKLDEVKYRVSGVVEGIREGFTNLNASLRAERRKHWLLFLVFLDALDKEVKETEERYRRQELNAYQAGIGLGITFSG